MSDQPKLKLKEMKVDKDAEEVKYEGKIDLSIKNNSHTLAFDLISNDSCGKKCMILEVGCSTGYFGHALKNAGNIVWGIEMNHVAAEKAKSVLDNVYVGSIEEFLADAANQNLKFDYVTFGDVLEHLPNPEKVLQACKLILSEDGAIIASIPNVAHIAVRLMLLEGRWEYSKLGIMDNTHLRFFTKSSIVEMFNMSALYIRDMDCVRIAIDSTGIKVNEAIRKHVEPILKDGEQDVFQYVLLAKKAGNTQDAISKTQRYLLHSKKILCLLPNTSLPLAKIRIIDPLRIWAANFGGAIRFRQISEFRDLDDTSWADAVIFQRESNSRTLNLIAFFKANNIKVIFDLDDLLTEVPKFISTYVHHKKTRQMLLKALKLSDVVTVTNERLRSELAPFNQEIFVIPNCSMPPSIVKTERHADGPINLLIAASDSIRVDFIVPVLRRLLEQNEIQFRIIGIGPPGKFIADAGVTITLYENMSHDNFKTFVSNLNNPIGLIPLDDSKFSSCKSAIKFIDYSLCGVVSVCSSVPPYSDIVEDNNTGMLVKNEKEDWYNAIMHLAKNPDLRKSISYTAYKLCEEKYTLNNSAKLWESTISSMQLGKNKLTHISYGEYKKRKIISLIYLYLLEPATYGAAIRLLRREGLAGLARRFKSIVLR